MIKNSLAAAVPTLALLLSGCAGQGAVALGQKIPSIADRVDDVFIQLVLEKAAFYHNLRVGLQQIEQTPGMVSMQMPPPVIIAGPMPVPMSPAPTPQPAPRPAPGPKPPVTPTPAPSPSPPAPQPAPSGSPPANLP